MNREQVNVLISELGQALDAGNLKLDERGFASLIGGDGVVINFDHVEDAGVLLFHATIGEIVEDRRLEIYDEMLKGNFVWDDTLGSKLSVTPDGRHAVIMVEIDVEGVESTTLLDAFRSMHKLTWAWVERFRFVADEDLPDHEAADDDPVDDPASTIPFPSQLA